MPLTDEQRDELFAAQDAWRAAHRRYADEASKYVVWWFESDDVERLKMPEPVDREALETLTRLNGEIVAAQNNYAALAERIRGLTS